MNHLLLFKIGISCIWNGICHWDMDIFYGDVQKWGISASNQQVCSGRGYHKHGKLVNPRKLNAGL